MRKLSRLALLLVLVPFWVGCGGSKPSRFYMLEAEPATTHPERPTKTVGIKKVTVSPYLQRNQIVTRTETGRLEVGEFDRWGEPLEDALRGALIENLRRELPQHRIVPWSTRVEADLSLQVRVEHFELTAGGPVRLSGIWQVESAGDSDPPTMGGFDLRREFTGPEKRNEEFYAGLVLVMSGLVAELAAEMAPAVR